jgi:hypothetical protein
MMVGKTLIKNQKEKGSNWLLLSIMIPQYLEKKNPHAKLYCLNLNKHQNQQIDFQNIILEGSFRKPAAKIYCINNIKVALQKCLVL